jgi:hypothetical protein
MPFKWAVGQRAIKVKMQGQWAYDKIQTDKMRRIVFLLIRIWRLLVTGPEDCILQKSLMPTRHRCKDTLYVSALDGAPSIAAA